MDRTAKVQFLKHQKRIKKYRHILDQLNQARIKGHPLSKLPYVIQKAPKHKTIIKDVLSTQKPKPKIVMPSHQISDLGYDRMIARINPFPQVYSNAFNGTSVSGLKLDIEPKSHHNIKAMILEFRITITGGPGYLIPAPFWLERSQIVNLRQASGQVIESIHPLAEFIKSGFVPDDNREIYGEMELYDPKTGWLSKEHKFYNGEIVRAYLEIKNPWFSCSDGINMLQFNDAWSLELNLTSNIIASGITSVQLNELNLITIEEIESEITKLTKVPPLNEVFNYLDTLVYSEQKTLTSGTLARINLDSFANKKIAFMIVAITDSISRTNASYLRFYSLGLNGSISVNRKAGQSIYSEGFSINQHQFKSLWVQYMNSNFGRIKNVYLIPFCEDVNASLVGKISDYFYMESGEYELQLLPGNAPVSTVESLTIDSSPGGSGFVRMMYKNELSGSIAYNASTVDLNNTWKALDSVICDEKVAFRDITFSNTINTDGTTITHTNSPDPVTDKIYFLSESMINSTSGNPNSYTETIFARGTSGFKSGSYYIHILAQFWKQVEIKDGRIVKIEAL